MFSAITFFCGQKIGWGSHRLLHISLLSVSSEAEAAKLKQTNVNGVFLCNFRERLLS